MLILNVLAKEDFFVIKYDFNGKIALVTGSSSGIGKGIAEALCKAGAIVILNSLQQDPELQATFEEFRQKGYNVFPIWADVSKEDQVKDMFETIDREFDRLDYLCNNAGIAINNSIENNLQSTWDKVLEVNLMGKMLCIKHAVPLLKKSKSPRIVNTSSRLGTKPIKNSSAYCCSQAGILMLTKCSALELAEYNIRVNAVSPALTLTPLATKKYTQQEIDNFAKENPAGRVCEVADTVNAVMFLLSEESDFITGESIEVSGGNLLI